MLALRNGVFVNQNRVASVPTRDREAPDVVAVLHLFEHVPRCTIGNAKFARERPCAVFPDSIARVGLRANVDKGESPRDGHAPIPNVLPDAAAQLQESVLFAHGTNSKDGSDWRIFPSRSAQTCSQDFGCFSAGKLEIGAL